MKAKRGSSVPQRVFDYHRVPSSVLVDPSSTKRPRPSSPSYSSTAALRMKSKKASSRINNSHTSKLDMAELCALKRELTAIKLQIDGLLHYVDKMDKQRKDSECAQSRKPSSPDSPGRGSVSSLEKESPEPGEASEDELLHYQNYLPHSCCHRTKQWRCEQAEDL